MMLPHDWQDSGFRALPALSAILLMLIISRLPVPFMDMAIPMLPALSAVYYWSLYRPSSIPLWFVALLSIMHDVVYGLALGCSLMVFLCVRLMARYIQRRLILQHFFMAWMLFALVVGVAFLVLTWIQSWIYNVAWFDVIKALQMVFIFTWFSYPLLHVLFNWFYRKLPHLSVRDHV